MVDFIIKERGQEVISLDQKESIEDQKKRNSKEPSNNFTEVNFEDLGKEKEE